jgi:hypothetical protein
MAKKLEAKKDANVPPTSAMSRLVSERAKQKYQIDEARARLGETATRFAAQYGCNMAAYRAAESLSRKPETTRKDYRFWFDYCNNWFELEAKKAAPVKKKRGRPPKAKTIAEVVPLEAA